MKKSTLLISLSLSGLIAIATAQESKDPFAKKSATDKAPSSSKAKSNSDQHAPKVLSICYETFSLPLADAAALQREGLSDSLLYQKLLEGIEKETVEQEYFALIRVRSGETSTYESIVEDIYPTEYLPAQLPSQLGVVLGQQMSTEESTPTIEEEKLARLPMATRASELSDISTPATPVSFETRNSGVTLELQANIGANAPIFDIRFNPEHTSPNGRSKWGQAESLTEFPEYETSRINTGITAADGKPSLIGTINRPPHSKIDTDSANKVWFAFVTPTIIVIRP